MFRLEYLEKVVPVDCKPIFRFKLDNKNIEMNRVDALALVSSIPAELRNCKVAFNTVILKASCK